MAEYPDYCGTRANWDLIPEHMIGGLRRYIENGIAPGSFLAAVLCNDLVAACTTADSINRHRLFDWCRFLYSCAPSGCWGSRDNYKKWIEGGGLQWPEVYHG
jgi:hypothetical protein